MQRGLFRKTILLLGDWAGLYLSLFLLVLIRYGNDWEAQWSNHFVPFSLLFPLWLVVIYGSYLYETRFFRPGVDTLRAMGAAVFISLFGSISMFYLFPPGLIQPRRNLVIFAAIFGLILSAWRFLAYKAVRTRVKTNVLFLGSNPEIKELVKFFKDNPELGYASMGTFASDQKGINQALKLLEGGDVNLLVMESSSKSTSRDRSTFSLLASGITAIDLEEFYERLLNKVSPEMLDESWFIRNLERINLAAYRFSKRFIDIVAGALGIILLAFLFLPIAILIKLNSSGQVIFTQKRVGKNGKIFPMYKFRTMKVLSDDGSAETGEAKWTQSEDVRITSIGKLLRITRVDELPQFINILRGDLSLVGPRPERPELVKKLEAAIPHYNMRHLIKPGLTGWAQINYRYGSSIKDAHIKLQYDIYYAKRKSLVLDFAIMLKTIRIVVLRSGR